MKNINEPKIEVKVPLQGWQCPVCGAVMSPLTLSCINCKGHLPYYPSYPQWPSTPYTPYPTYPTVTCYVNV